VLNVVKLLIFFPTKGGVIETLSPKNVMSGETLDYKNHLRLQIGQYFQVHEEDHPRNSQLACTKGAISLGPSGHLQGGFRFMALNTRKKIVRLSWGVIPMPDVVIAQVNALGSDQPRQMTFTDIHGHLIRDIEIPGVDSHEEQEDTFPGMAPVIDDDIEIPGVDVAGPEALDESTAPQIEINDLGIHQDNPAQIEVATPQKVLIPQVRLAHKYPNPPWEMIHPLGEIMQYVCNLTRFTRLGVTSHSQPLINTKHKFQVTNYLQTIV
jgi:hypothetical protein